MPKISLIVLAAGDSSRFELPTKKQFLRVGGEPLWLYATRRLSGFYAFKKVVVACENPKYMQKFAPHYSFVKGAKSRAASLRNALCEVNSDFVMVSDSARPKIPRKIVLKLIENAQNADCITPALKVADTTLYKEEPINRDFVRLVQTPQLSNTALLRKALEKNADFSDDSSAIASVGGKIWFIQGSQKADKITFAKDLARLKLPAPSGEMFCGNGFDTHSFGEKRALKLGGVVVSKEMGVKAHSDGDLLAHAFIDALLGAAALGDIGEHFSDKDAQNKGADSMKMLVKVYKMVCAFGFELVNADFTIIAETPKLMSYKDAINKNVAKTLGVPEFRINTKATTAEKMGFVGRKEGLCVLASVNLRYFDWTFAVSLCGI